MFRPQSFGPYSGAILCVNLDVSLHLSNAKGVGAGVFGYRINFGPGYRIYFGKDGDTLIVLLGGGTKARQRRDVETAGNLWRESRRRDREKD